MLDLKNEVDNSLVAVVPYDEAGAMVILSTFILTSLAHKVATRLLPPYVSTLGGPRAPDATDVTVLQTASGLTAYYRWYTEERIPKISEYSIGYSSAGFTIQ